MRSEQKLGGAGTQPDRPARFRNRQLACAGGVFIAALVLYVWTLAPTVTLVDSGELIVAAHELGVAHPPGFPLYVLLAHAATRLPLGNAAVRVHFASAVFAALAAALLAAIVAEVLLVAPRRQLQPTTGKGSVRRKNSAQLSQQEADASTDRPLLGDGFSFVPPLFAGALIACSRTLWAYATIAEVYTLNTALLLVVMLLMFRWRRRLFERPVTNGSDRPLYAAAFVFGLALGVHHVTLGLALPALAALVSATAGARFFASRRLLCAALCATVGLLIYAYLPLAAAHSPLLNWGDPRTVQRVWWHVTGRQYQSYFAFSPPQIGAEAGAFLRRVSHEFGPWWMPAAPVLAVIGFRALFRRDRALCVCLILILVADVAYGLSYVIDEDKDAYYLPAFVTIAIAAGCGASQLIRVAASGRRRRYTAALAAAGLLIVPIVALVANVRFNDRSRYFVARDYVENIFRTIAPGSMLLTLDWQVYSPMLYTRSIEHARRDVTVIDVHLLRRSWYFDYLRREYPQLMGAAGDHVESFLTDLRQWEQDPAGYARDPALTRRIDTRFHDMTMAFVRWQLQSAPVYVTQDIALNRDPQNSRLAQSLASAYRLVPQGLAFQLVADRAFHDPAEPQLQTRGLVDGTLQFEADDVVRLKVFPAYVSMLYNRGVYLVLHGRHARAIEAFTQALALDPAFQPAQRALSDSLTAARTTE